MCPVNCAYFNFFINYLFEFRSEGTGKTKIVRRSLGDARSEGNFVSTSQLHFQSSGIDLFAWTAPAAVDADDFCRSRFGETSLALDCNRNAGCCWTVDFSLLTSNYSNFHVFTLIFNSSLSIILSVFSSGSTVGAENCGLRH